MIKTACFFLLALGLALALSQPVEAQKPELVVQTGHINYVQSVAFSPDGRTLASGSADNTVKLWDVQTGQELRTFRGHTNFVMSVAFSPDGRTIASGSDDKTVKLWDVQTGRLLGTFTGHAERIEAVAFSPDGESLASSSMDAIIKLWDARTRKELHTLRGHTNNVGSVAFSPDGKILVSGSIDRTIKLWSVQTGLELHTLTGHKDGVRSVAFSPDGRTVASGSWDHHIKLWDVQTGHVLHTLTGHTDDVYSVVFSPDGKTLASGSDDKTIKLWSVQSGLELRSLTGHTASVRSVAFSPDSRTVASGSWDSTIKIQNVQTGREINTLIGHTDSVDLVSFSPDGRLLLRGSGDGIVKKWDLTTGAELPTLTRQVDNVQSSAFSPDGKIVANAQWDRTIKLSDVATGTELHILAGHSDEVRSVTFSSDGKMLASGSDDKTVKLWDVQTGLELRTLRGHSNSVGTVAFSPDSETLASGSEDSIIKFWNVQTGRMLASLYALDQKDWAVVDPQGRFDASPGGMKQMHYVVGLEPIDLSQLKERYYEPGLLAKLLGYDKTPLRDVPAFDEVRLYPKVDVSPLLPGRHTLTIRLTNQGGGIGPVQVYVNGQIYTKDARPKGTDPNIPKLTLTVNLAGVPNAKPGQGNQVKVVALNYDPKTKQSYLQSRGTEEVWTRGDEEQAHPVRHLWGIIVGVSDYASPRLRLGYAAKDADSFAAALQLAGEGLFTPARVYIIRLNTTGKPGALSPTKANIEKAFAEVKAQAGPEDILVVYLAGHGIALPAENSLYCYLTSDARTGDTAALNDPVVRGQTTVTSHELADWISGAKGIKANFKVMVLDTCAAGAAATEMASVRALDGDQVRAMDRFQGQTGFHVLMGCASDAVSYEASRYGQGLLTYCLLQGMRGAALDNSLVDVSTLFTYAEKTVPDLVRSENGGIQQPKYQKPEGVDFDIGRLSDAARTQIPLETPKPQILRPTLFDPAAKRDDLRLSELLGQTLRDQFYAAARGDVPLPAVFVDADTMPGAVQASGNYTVTGSAVSVSLSLFQDNKEVAVLQPIEGSKDDLASLAAKLAASVTEAAARLK